MVVTIGSSSDKVRIGDNATAGQGSYEVYLNPLQLPESWDFPCIEGAEIASPGDTNIGAKAGTIIVNFLIRGCKMAMGQTAWDNLKIACVYWSKNSSLLYYTENYNSTNMARWPAYSDYSMVNYYRVKVNKIEVTEKNTDVWTFNVGLHRYST